MNQKIFRIGHLVFIFSLYYSTGQAQFLLNGFDSKKGKGTVAVSRGYAKFDKYYAHNQTLNLSRETNTLGFYADYTPVKHLKLAFSFPYIKTEKGIEGFQDFFLQAKWQPQVKIKGKPYALISHGFPLTDYETNKEFSIGQQARLWAGGAGIQWTGNWWFVNISYQHQLKYNPVPNAHQYLFQAGMFTQNWFGSVRFEKQTSVDGADYRDGSNSPFKTLGAAYEKFAVDVFRRITKKVGVAIYAAQIISGRNMGNNKELFVNLVWEFNATASKEKSVAN